MKFTVLKFRFISPQMFDLKSRHESLFAHLPSTVEQAMSGMRSVQSALHSLDVGSLNISHKHQQTLLAEIHVIFKIIQSVSNINLFNSFIGFCCSYLIIEFFCA